MADLKAIRHLFDLQDPTGFNMTSPENLMSQEEDESTPENDPMAFAPAEEADQMSTPGALASPEDIAKIQSLPLPDAQRSLAKSPEAMPTEEEPVDKNSKIQNILEELQKHRSQGQQNLGLLTGANQIAQAMAAGYGGKIGDGSEQIKMLQGQYEQPIKDYKERIENEENDPNSDVSKFMREQAYATLKKLNPEKTYDLEKMTAAQLKKAMGSKLLGSANAPMEWIPTDRVTADGFPIKFNRRTGQYMAGDRIVNPGENIARDISRRDALTGAYGRTGATGGLEVQPTKYTNVENNLKGGQSNAETGKAENVKFSDFMKAAPEVSKDIIKIKQDFLKDMKDSRDTAAASVTLASKLKPGANGEIDSGLLGGIQTQAAKIAGQKGVLTDQDLVKFAGAGGVAAKIQRIIDGSLFGNMSDTDVKFFKRFSELMNSSLGKIIENDSQIHIANAKQIAEGFAPGISDDNIREWLAVDKVAPSVQGNKSKDAKVSDLVTIQGPSGQTVKMKKAAAEKYLKQPGYKLVD